MKKYSVQLAILVLFTAIFASGMAIGMELPELPPQILGGDESLPQLPSDVKKIIANKTLRLILDEAEDNPIMLMEEKESLTESIQRLITISFLAKHGKTPVIDFIILLIENGANPNTKNYEGRTAGLFLVLDFISRTTEMLEESSAREKIFSYSYSNYVASLETKIKILVQRGMHLNEKISSIPDVRGGTLAHMLIRCILPRDRKIFRTRSFERVVSFAMLLKSLGLDFTTIKNDDGFTACELGKKIKAQLGGYSSDDILRDLCK